MRAGRGGAGRGVRRGLIAVKGVAIQPGAAGPVVQCGKRPGSAPARKNNKVLFFDFFFFNEKKKKKKRLLKYPSVQQWTFSSPHAIVIIVNK